MDRDGSQTPDNKDGRRISKIMPGGAMGDQNSGGKISDPKDKLGENLISREEYEELSAKFRKPNGEEM